MRKKEGGSGQLPANRRCLLRSGQAFVWHISLWHSVFLLGWEPHHIAKMLSQALFITWWHNSAIAIYGLHVIKLGCLLACGVPLCLMILYIKKSWSITQHSLPYGSLKFTHKPCLKSFAFRKKDIQITVELGMGTLVLECQ